MQVVQVPQALPACCIFCPGSVRKQYVDTGMQMDWYGAVYVCDQCLMDMGRMIGMLSHDQATLLIESNAEMATEIFHLKKKLSGLEAGLHGLVDSGYINPSVLAVVDSDDGSAPDDSVLQGADEGGEGGSHGSEAILGSGEGTAPESVHDEGVGVVRTDGVRSSGGEFII